MAATTISTLAAKLTLRTSEFTSGLNSMASRITNFVSKTASMVSSIAGSIIGSLFNKVTGLLALITGGGLLYLFNQLRKAIDMLGKMSDTINVTTRNLSSLQLGAELAGTSASVLNRAMQIFGRRIGEASIGAGEAVKAFKMLNLSWKTLASIPMDQALMLVADQIQKLPTMAQKTGAAFMLFGRQGVLISNFLQQGSAGIREMMVEADQLGITFSRLDSAKVEAMNDSFVKVKYALTGIGYQLIIRLAGPLQWISDKLVAFIKTFKGGARELAFRSLNWVTLKIDSLIMLTNDFIKAFLWGLKAVAPVIGQLLRSLSDIGLSMIDMWPAIKDFFGNIKEGGIAAAVGIGHVSVSLEELSAVQEAFEKSRTSKNPFKHLWNWLKLNYYEGYYIRQKEALQRRQQRMNAFEEMMRGATPGEFSMLDKFRAGLLQAGNIGDSLTQIADNAYNNFRGLKTGVNSWWREMQKASPEAKKIAEGHKMNTDALADLNDVELKELKTLKERNRTVKEGLFLNAKLAYTAVEGAAIVKAQESSSYLDKLGNEETARIKREESLTAQNERIMAANEKALDKSGNEEQVMTNSLLQELINTIKNSRTGLDFATEGVD